MLKSVFAIVSDDCSGDFSIDFAVFDDCSLYSRHSFPQYHVAIFGLYEL